MRVRQEAVVQHHLGSSRGPVPVAERYYANAHLVSGAFFPEPVSYRVPERMHCVLRRIYYDIGHFADLGKQPPLLMDCSKHVLLRQRVRPPRFAVSSNKEVVVSFEEHDCHGHPLAAQLVFYPWKGPQKLPRSRIDDKGGPLYLARLIAQCNECRN